MPSVAGVCDWFEPITAYDAAVAKAHAFHRDHPCQIKVLPVTGPEARNLLGISLPERPQPMDVEVRQQIVTTLTDVATNSSDCDARRDAISLLREMGVLQS